MDALKKFAELFKTYEFIIVRQGKKGIETYIDESLFRVNDAYKKQISTWLEDVVRQLRGKK